MLKDFKKKVPDYISLFDHLKDTPVKLSKESKDKQIEVLNFVDWSRLSPMFFSTVFESFLEKGKRHERGMHYTSEENIHKIIDPVFLWDLAERVDNCIKNKDVNAARELQKEIGELKFFDPACGSGNFLFETYMSLRELENKLIKLRKDRTDEWLGELSRLAGLND